MKSITRLLVILYLILIPVAAYAQDSVGEIIVISPDGPLTPAMVDYIDRGITIAEQDGAELLIIRLNTPGGSIDLMNEIVQHIRGSAVPVVVYVAPNGAIAGSAGTVITLAGHVAAMAPETAIGAASPIDSSGSDIGATLEAKIKEAIKATMRSLMEDRPPEAIALAEATVDDAKAATAREALSVGMIDIVASDLPDLLRQLDGRTVKLGGQPHTLQTAYSDIREIQPSFIEQLLGALTNPNIVFLLLSLGIQAVLIELGNPGGWVAGFIGAVCLTLAGYGIGLLAVNWLGLIFLALSFALFIMDIKTPTMGGLTAAGVVSFIIGALVLFNSPSTPEFQRVSVPLVVIMGVFTGGVFALIVMFAFKAQQSPVRMGQASLVGQVGVVREAVAPSGQIQLGGERWSAHLAPGEAPIPKGSRAEVVEARGIRIYVRAAERESSNDGESPRDQN